MFAAKQAGDPKAFANVEPAARRAGYRAALPWREFGA